MVLEGDLKSWIIGWISGKHDHRLISLSFHYVLCMVGVEFLHLPKQIYTCGLINKFSHEHLHKEKARKPIVVEAPQINKEVPWSYFDGARELL